MTVCRKKRNVKRRLRKKTRKDGGGHLDCEWVWHGSPNSDLQDKVMRLGRQNSYLRSKQKIRNGISDRSKEAQRSKQRRAKHKEDEYVAGHKRVKVAERQQPETSFCSIDFKSEIEDDISPMAAAIGSCMVRRPNTSFCAMGVALVALEAQIIPLLLACLSMLACAAEVP